MTGDAIPVVDDVLRADTAGFAEFSASATGTLVYSDDYTWEGKKRLVWLDRKGREFGTLGPPGHYWATIAQSPDKKRVAVSFTAPGEFNPDIWMLDIVRNVATRFTSDPGGEFWPVWSPDGATVYFYAMRLGTYRVWMKPASGIGEERELPMPPGDAAPQAVTPDGRFLLSYWGQPGGHPSGKYDIVKTSLNANPHTTPLGISSRALGTGPLPHSLSPDGKWIAYFSFESGRAEVYVVDFPGLTGKWRVSVDGGQWPRWSPSGKELFFVAPGGKLMSAPVSTVPTFHVGRLDRVLEATPKILVYAPISGGDRFLAAVDAKDEKLPPTKVVLDWQAAVGRR